MRAKNWNNDGPILPRAAGTAPCDGRRWDLRPLRLLANGPAPSPRAALLSEALQRLWGVRLDGLALSSEPWSRLLPRDGSYLEHEIEIDLRPAVTPAARCAEPSTSARC